MEPLGPEADLVEVHHGKGDVAVGRIIETRLEDEGIPCRIEPDGGLSYGFSILVRKEDAQRARDLIAEGPEISDEERVAEYGHMRPAIRPYPPAKVYPRITASVVGLVFVAAAVIDLFLERAFWPVLLPAAVVAFAVAVRSPR